MKRNILFVFLVVLGLAGCDQVANRLKGGEAASNTEAPKSSEAVASSNDANKSAPTPEAASQAANINSELALKQDKAKAYLNQAFSYITSANIASSGADKEKLLKNAETELSNAINVDGNYFAAYLNRGVVLMALGKLNKAEDDLKKAQTLDPKSPDAYFNLACLYSVTNKLDLSADALDSALKNGFNNVDRLRSDPDLNQLRQTKDFKKILEKYKFFIN
jgi:tetratricopeptide (TPR) repeat protein